MMTRENRRIATWAHSIASSRMMATAGLVSVLLIVAGVTITAAAQSIFTRDELIADARKLAQIIADTHPDPYLNGGGRIAYCLRLQEILEAIPEDGMTQDDFTRLLRPFVAAVGDAHTEIWGPTT